MAIHAAGGLGGPARATNAAGGKETFRSTFKESLPTPVQQQPKSHLPPVGKLEQLETQKAAQWMDRVHAAQARLDHVFQLAQSGRNFTPLQLLALQAQVSGASQQLELATRVVEKATSGVKQVLQTQV